MSEHKRPLIIFSRGTQNAPLRRLRPNFFKQNLLLKGLMLKPTLEAAAKYAGVRTMVEAYALLDRIAMRQDYQAALKRWGIDFDFIVQGFKDLAMNSEVDGVRLNALRTILQSLGVASYDKDEGTGRGSWEEMVRQAVAEEKTAQVKSLPVGGRYAVSAPVMPESVLQKRQPEKKLEKELYGDQYPAGTAVPQAEN